MYHGFEDDGGSFFRSRHIFDNPTNSFQRIKPIIEKPTFNRPHKTRIIESIIDHCFSNNLLTANLQIIHDNYHLSDHNPLFLSIPLSITLSKNSFDRWNIKQIPKYSKKIKLILKTRVTEFQDFTNNLTFGNFSKPIIIEKSIDKIITIINETVCNTTGKFNYNSLNLLDPTDAFS